MSLTIIPTLHYGRPLGGNPTTVPAKIEGASSTPNSAYEAWAKAHNVGGPPEDIDKDGRPNLIEAVFGSDPTVYWPWGCPYLGVKYRSDGTSSQTIDFPHVGMPGVEIIPMIGDKIGGVLRPAKFDEVDALMPMWGNMIPFSDEREFKAYASGENEPKFIDAPSSVGRGIGRQTFQLVAKAKLGAPASVLGVCVKLP